MSTVNASDGKRDSQAAANDRRDSLVSDILPLATPRFRGRVGNTYVDSEADLIALPTAPAGAPNVLLVLLDDVGFGQTSTFGGPANTPTLQRLADEGLRYNTLIIYIVGDNGPSGEGSLTGTLNNMKTQLGLLDDVSFMLKHIDEIGGRCTRTTTRWAGAGQAHRRSSG